MPGSGPTDPDSAERLAAVVAALQNGAPPTGLNVSDEIAKILVSSPIVHDDVLVGGTTGQPHKLYEVPFSAGTWAFLSPVVAT